MNILFSYADTCFPSRRSFPISFFFNAQIPSKDQGWPYIPCKSQLCYLASRRKFRSQTSDNMDRWKAEKGRGREKRKILEERRVRRKKMQMREKVGKSRNTVFFQWFGAPEGQKVGSLKRRVQSHLARWEMKSCTPLWREAHFEVKMYKTPQHRTTFGSWDVEKVHTVVARSTFRNQNVKNTRGSDHFWRFRCRFAWQAQGIVHLFKVSKTWGFCSISQNDGRHGAFEDDLQRCIFRGRGSAKDMLVRDVRRSGRWFPERGWILEYQMCRFAKMILRDRCSTSYDLASVFRGRHSPLDRWSGKIAKRIGTRPSALHSTFHFWRTSRRIASFLMLSTSKIEEASQNSLKIEEVSQTCFVFDVVNFNCWGSLAA